MAPAVLTPVQVRHAYGFDQIRFQVGSQSIVGDGRGQTIAIVNAYDNTRIFSDLDTFDRTFSINGAQTLYQQYGPASSFLTKVNVQGTPGADPTGGLWHLETALDVEWAHAMAPAARILLVQAKSNSYANLLNAVDYARKQPGVVAVSLSWGSSEFSSETYYDSYFTTPLGHLGGSNGRGGPNLPGGVTFVAASGDGGAPGLWPAMSPWIVSVGGTTLSVDAAGNYLSELAWSGSGGGISRYEARPAYQSSVNAGTKRTLPDVSYNGDPATGVYVYSTMPLYGKPGSWWQVGGTSAGSPQWAALVAIADQGRALAGRGSLDGFSQTLPALYYVSAGDFHDITKGSNGYSAGPGYDLVSGRGTPFASRIVADLLRADAQGKLTLTVTPATTSASAGPAGIRPLIWFAGIGLGEPTVMSGPASAPVILSWFSAPDIVSALAAAERTPANPHQPITPVSPALSPTRPAKPGPGTTWRVIAAPEGIVGPSASDNVLPCPDRGDGREDQQPTGQPHPSQEQNSEVPLPEMSAPLELSPEPAPLPHYYPSAPMEGGSDDEVQVLEMGFADLSRQTPAAMWQWTQEENHWLAALALALAAVPTLKNAERGIRNGDLKCKLL
jgi:hypothetical protein